MKRYIAIDLDAIKSSGLSLMEWSILENIHFMASGGGYCFATRKSLAYHHDISIQRIRSIIANLIDTGWLKRNSKNHLKTTKKWFELQGTQKQEGYSKTGTQKQEGGYSKTSTEGTQKQAPLPIKKELKGENKESIEKNIQKKFSFSLTKKQSYNNLSEEYKQKLKAKCFLIDGNIDRYEDFVLSLESGGYKYQDFSLAYMKWDKDKNYKNHIRIPEPKLGEDWYRVHDGNTVYAINSKTYEIKMGVVK